MFLFAGFAQVICQNPSKNTKLMFSCRSNLTSIVRSGVGSLSANVNKEQTKLSLRRNIHLCHTKLQALVYGILPSTIAVFSYAIGQTKQNKQKNCQLMSSFFVGAQAVVRLLQTTQIISVVCFITDHGAYTSSNKTKIVWIETELFFYPGWMRLMFTCVLGR